MTTVRLASFSCQECADRQYVSDPFGGRELVPCPECCST
jgi:hypothetical protein